MVRGLPSGVSSLLLSCEFQGQQVPRPPELYHLADLYKDPPFLIIGYYNLEVT